MIDLIDHWNNTNVGFMQRNTSNTKIGLLQKGGLEGGRVGGRDGGREGGREGGR